MKSPYILSIDQGTSSTKCIVVDAEGQLIAKGSASLQTIYLNDGWVEQDPEAILDNVLDALKNCLKQLSEAGYEISDIQTCGISNQRETFVLWDDEGRPLYNAVVWQCKRSTDICEEWKPLEGKVREKTGLLIDPYFSASKAAWLLRKYPEMRGANFGTIDSWLLYKLTGRHITDHTNASRTLFFNLHTKDWDQEILNWFGLETLRLPAIQASASFFGETDFGGLLDEAIPINAMIGDSHSAAFGEGCFSPGTAKATLGTGCSILMNIGNKPQPSGNGMVTTVCWSTEDRIDYALEGVIVSCGASLEWMRESMKIFSNVKETETIARNVEDNGGVYLVPAFSGLGAPHWEMNRKASISGLTFNTSSSHLVRAALESIPYQIKDVIVAMEADAQLKLQELMVNGGMTSNEFVLTFLSNLLDTTVRARDVADISALGAALLAGLKAGIFKNIEHLKSLSAEFKAYQPELQPEMAKWYLGWQKAIKA